MAYLRDYLVPQSKSKIKAGDGMQFGEYRFFTSSPIQSKYYHTATYDKPALIFGTGGNASVHYCDEPFATSTDCLVMYGAKGSNLELIYHYLHTNLHLLQAGFKGAGLQHISKEYILDISIDLPEGNEQNHLLTEIRIIDSLINARHKQLSKLDELVKSQFIELFGDNEYPEYKLSEVCEKITDGTHKTPNYQDEGITFISAKNIVDGKLNFSDIKHITITEYEEIQKRCRLEQGDLLMSKSGSLGSLAIVDTDEPLGLFESLAIIKYNRQLLNGIFLMEQLRSDKSQGQLMSGVKGVAVKHLHLNVISETTVIAPPLEQQLEFAKTVQQTDKSKFEIQKSLEKLETLKKALMQKYFG